MKFGFGCLGLGFCLGSGRVLGPEFLIEVLHISQEWKQLVARSF